MNQKSNKAVSPVIASIILIAITVATAIAATAWMGALTYGYMDQDSQTVQNLVSPPIDDPSGTDENDQSPPTPTPTETPSPTPSPTPTPTPSPTHPTLTPNPTTEPKASDFAQATKAPTRPPPASPYL